MDTAVSKVKLEQQVAGVLALDAIVKYHDWKLEVEGLLLFVSIRPRTLLSKGYLARLTYDDFPQRAPSLTFVDMETRKEGKEFWPQHGSAFGSAVSREPPQLCIEGLREFHEQLHRRWAWDADRYPLAKTLEAIQAELDKDHPAS